MRTRHRIAATVIAALACSAGVAAQPVAVDDTYAPGSGVLFESDPGVLENDGGVTGSAVAELVSDVSYGTLALDPEGVFTYTSDSGFFGVDSFTYRIVDGTVTSNTATVTLTVEGCKGGPTGTTTVCWVEGAFLEAVAAADLGTIAEGYESSPPWPRTPDLASAVSSQGVTWRSNQGANFVTTNDGPARTGGWAVYSDPHGSQTGSGTCNPAVTGSLCDGFVGSGPGGDALFAAGGWVKSNTGTGKIRFLLRYVTNPQLELTFPLEVATAIHRFFGVIDTAGFEEFEVVEIEGTLVQQIFVFGDDFTVGVSSTPDSVPPTVTAVDTFEDTGDGQLVDGETTTASITDLYVVFSEPVQDPGGDTEPDDVTNPANYLLVDDGGDGFETTTCAGGVSGNDTAVTVDAVTWTSGSQLEAWLELNGGTALPAATYRLLVCGTTSIRDWAGNPLDGDTNGVGGDDFVLDFTVETNQAPVADDQSVATDEDTAKAITLTASDGNGDPLTYFITSYPPHGGLTGTPPDVTYTPDADYNGPDSFTFQAWDGTATSNTATVSITVNPINDAPTATDDGHSTDEDTPLSVAAPGVLGNDSDPEGDTLTAIKVTDPTNGTVTLSSDGSFTYTPNADFNGPDSFTYKANDGLLDSNVATVTITVNPINDTPTATDDGYVTDEDTPLSVAASGVLSNDTDPDGDTLTAIKVTDPTNGTVTLSSDGSFTYTPNADFHGSDSFTYTANDTLLDSNVATVTITIEPINDAPTADAGVDQSVAVTDTVLLDGTGSSDVEGGGLSYAWSWSSRPPTSAANLTGANTANPSFVVDVAGTYVVQLIVNDGLLDSAPDTVTISTQSTAPVADDQSVTTDEDVGLPITLTASDVDGDPLSYAVVTGPSHGGLTGTPPTVTYTPAANYHGSDSFTFRANDGVLDSNLATVSITVQSVNDAPVANDQSVTTVEDTAVPITLTATDVESGGLSFSIVSPPTHGVLSGTPPTVTYTPGAGYVGSDSFTFVAHDGSLDSNLATVTLAVTSATTTWYVATTGDDANDCLSALTPCLTVAGAIGKAASGDTVSVAAGTYPMTGLTVDKDLSVVGVGSATVLDGGGAGLGIGTTGGARLGFRDLSLRDAAGG